MYSLLNPFPIQFLAMFAYFLLRVCVGLVLLYLGKKHWRARRELGLVFTLSWWPYGKLSAVLLAVFELILGGLFIVGAYTQYAALGLLLMSVKMLVLRNQFTHHTLPSPALYFLLVGISLSLFITGAGALAVDLPI